MHALPGNNLVVHVISARGLHIKGGKAVDVYCSLSSSGKGPWKSKVNTNAINVDPHQQQHPASEVRWDEHCEFQLNDTDTKLVVHVNHKTVFGTTETLGELVLQLAQMARFQPPAWFQLNKAGSADFPLQSMGASNNRERGQIQLGFQFSNVLGSKGATSISNMSLNKTEKERKFNRIKRKMQQLGRKTIGGTGDSSTANGDGNDDAKSLASISIAAGQLSLSRRSSISSNNSGALAFTPSPIPTPIPDELIVHTTRAAHKTTTSTTAPDQLSMHSFSSINGGEFANHHPQNHHHQQQQQRFFQATPSDSVSNNQHNNQQQYLLQPGTGGGTHSASARSSVSGCSGKQQQSANETPPVSSEKLHVKMRHKAEQLIQLRALAGGGGTARKQQKQRTMEAANNNNNYLESDHQQPTHSRHNSLASSSGFVSFGSGQLSSLNEHTSPEHLLNVIKHLRGELLKKDQRIRDLEEYTDKLVNKVMMINPELLQASPKLGTSNISRSARRF